MAFRLLDQKPQYRAADGSLLAGGSLNFFITSTTTPKNCYSDKTLGTSLGAVITLDSDARHSEDIWLAEDAAYRIVAKDSDGVTVWQLEDVRSADIAAGNGLPAASEGSDGQILFTDGSVGYYADPDFLPSMAGNSGKVLGNDGEAAAWQSITTTYTDTSLPGGVYQSSTTYTQIGKLRTYYGSSSAPTSGTDSTSVVISSLTFVSGPVHVTITPTIDSVTQEGAVPVATWASPTATGFTAKFKAPHEDISGQTSNIDSAVTFTYSATGLVA